MKKIIFIPILAFSIFLSACKKDTTSNKSVADSYVGIWNVKDSVFFNGSFDSKHTYNATLVKKSDNQVYFINFYWADTILFSVTENNLSYLSTSNNSSPQPCGIENFIGAKSGNNIVFSATCSNSAVTGSILKQ